MTRLIFTILLLCGFHNLLACSCEALLKINKASVSKAKAIFIGRVRRVESTSQHSQKVTFQVTENLKAAETNEVIIYTPIGSSNCGLNIREGQEWYIFAYAENGDSWVGLCGRSALLSAHSISPNPYKKVYYKHAVKEYEQARRRSRKEIAFIKDKGKA